MKKDKVKTLLSEIILLVEHENHIVSSHRKSVWTKDELDVVESEIRLLLNYINIGKVHYRFGRKQKMLESTYLITDSLKPLSRTTLGKKILLLQKLFK